MSLARPPSSWLAPLLPGATSRERLIACIGACLCIACTGLLSSLLVPGASLPFIVAPLGASAVLLFAVPASPLAQPWPIVGGNTLAALVGICVARIIPDATLASGVAVALAIAAMSMARCLHPPGGAAALTGVIGGPAVAAAGFKFALAPVLINSVILVGLGWLFHRVSGRTYPHVAAGRPTTPLAPAGTRDAMSSEDIDLALRDLGETLDIERQDLEALIVRAEFHATERLRRPRPT